MANRNLFASLRSLLLPQTDTVNSEQMPAYALAPKQALAQYASTGCFGRTFYASAEEQLARVLELCASVEPEFVAKVAIYSRAQAHMKDMPALLCAWLSMRDARLHEVVFARVIDTTRMLRSYVQIQRSGVVGRKSLGSAPKRLVSEWLASREADELFRTSAGQSPSLADIVKMVHPKPADAERKAFYGYLIGHGYERNALPKLVLEFEEFKTSTDCDVPDLPFTLLAALELTREHWIAIAANASWQTTRMNLNTFARHGVFETESMAERIAERLRDVEAMRRARVLPYQLLTAYRACNDAVPTPVRDALQDALEAALANVPVFEGRVVVCPDVSGSMLDPVTGAQGSATSVTQCVDVAALIAAAVLRKNATAEVMPFAQDLIHVALNGRDSVMTNATRLRTVAGGGTNCSAPMRVLNERKAKADLVVYVSDNESWVDARCAVGTALLAEWNVFRKRNPHARLVCIDLRPNATTQALEREDVLNIGGFSDAVFETVAAFSSGRLEPDHWVAQIEALSV